MKNKAQHYIPQYYLRGFSNNRRINIFDKDTVRVYSNSIKNIAFGKHYHNIEEKFIKMYFYLDKESLSISPDDTQFVDKIINQYHENLMVTFVQSFNKTHELESIKLNSHMSIIDSHSLIDILLLQFFRTDNFRNVIKRWFVDEKYGCIPNELAKSRKDSFNKAMNTYHNIFLLGIMSQLFYKSKGIEPNVLFFSDFKPLLDTYKGFKKSLIDSAKSLYVNHTSIEFIASDSPLTALWTDMYDDFKTVIFPINKHCAFVLTNTKLMSGLYKAGDRTVESVTKPDTIRKLNTAILSYANRFIYSSQEIKNDVFYNIEIPFE